MLGQQLRYVVRKLVHSPLFTGVALLTLAIAIGANTAVFSVVNAVVIKPLPFEDADRLVGLWQTSCDTSTGELAGKTEKEEIWERPSACASSRGAVPCNNGLLVCRVG